MSLGCGSLCILGRDLSFGAEPVVEVVTVLDNRTSQTYNFPIARETVRAMDFRQIKASPEDFGLMTYDPAFMNTASCRSSILNYPRVDRLWMVANQADEAVVLDKSGRTVAKLGDSTDWTSRARRAAFSFQRR